MNDSELEYTNWYVILQESLPQPQCLNIKLYMLEIYVNVSKFL